MRKILLSIVMILTSVGLVAGATRAVFTSQAVLGTNTFSTGILEIRLNGVHTLAGFNFANAAPGDVASKAFTLMNYGLPWFPGGPSTLPAKGLLASFANQTGDVDLFNTLNARLYNNAGWSGCSNGGIVWVPGKGCTVYNGPLSGLINQDILFATQWGAHPSLVPGNSFSMLLEVELPVSAGDSLQGKSTTFDLQVNASSNYP